VVAWLSGTGALAWVGVTQLSPQEPSGECISCSWGSASLGRDERRAEEYPLNAEAHCRLGYSYLRSGRPDEALDPFRRALLLESDYVDALLGLARAWGDLENWEQAEAALGFALQFESDYAYTHLLLGWVLEQQGRLDEAADACREAISLAPDYTDACEQLIWTLTSAGRYGEAAAAIEDASDLEPGVVEDAYTQVAAGLADEGRFSEAARLCEKAVRVVPDSLELRRQLALAYLNTGEDGKAMAQAEAIAQTDVEGAAEVAVEIVQYAASRKARAE
jgi:tetratricopeptide (TPR) repeat protein